MERWQDIHKRYEAAPAKVRLVVDAAFSAVQECLFQEGFKAFEDDRAERLVSAIYLYVEAGNSSTPTASAPGPDGTHTVTEVK